MTGRVQGSEVVHFGWILKNAKGITEATLQRWLAGAPFNGLSMRGHGIWVSFGFPSVRTVNGFETEVMHSEVSLTALGGWLGCRQEEQLGDGAVVHVTWA